MSKYLDYFYAAYGSNLNLDQMKSRCPDAIYIQNITLKNCQLTFRSNWKNGVMNIEKGTENITLGLFKITKEDEDSLDIYEGYPNLYIKKFVKTKLLNGKTVKVMMYVMKEKLPLSLPSVSYYNTVIRGYNECNINMEQLFNAYDYSYTKRRERIYAQNI